MMLCDGIPYSDSVFIIQFLCETNRTNSLLSAEVMSYLAKRFCHLQHIVIDIRPSRNCNEESPMEIDNGRQSHPHFNEATLV